MTVVIERVETHGGCVVAHSAGGSRRFVGTLPCVGCAASVEVRALHRGRAAP